MRKLIKLQLKSNLEALNNCVTLGNNPHDKFILQVFSHWRSAARVVTQIFESKNFRIVQLSLSWFFPLFMYFFVEKEKFIVNLSQYESIESPISKSVLKNISVYPTNFL